MAGESGQELKFDLTDLYVAASAFTRAGGTIGDAVSQAASQLEGLGTFWGNRVRELLAEVRRPEGRAAAGTRGLRRHGDSLHQLCQ